MLSRCAASVNEALRACATGWPQIAAGVLLNYRYFVGQRSDRPYVLSSAKYGLRESLILLEVVLSICLIAAIVLL